MVYEHAETLLENTEGAVGKKQLDNRVDQLRDLMIKFGELAPDTGKYQVSAGFEGFEDGRSRAGYTELPGVSVGKIAEALSFDTLLESEFWSKTRFYQPSDFVWQPTLFQPVGGMDQVQKAFAHHVEALGCCIYLNSPVKAVDYDFEQQEYLITVSSPDSDEVTVHRADYVFSNMAIPFLSKILSNNLQQTGGSMGLEPKFKSALHQVYAAQFEPEKQATAQTGENGYVARFLACTSKVGWQAERSLWQGSQVTTCYNDEVQGDVYGVPDSEVGVVPIFGGISWTDHDITQIWYPSTAYHDKQGVLTAAYNFSQIAHDWGQLPIDKRLEKAREGATAFDHAFGKGLHSGIAIAWQNMPYIKGGWAQWQALGEADFATKQFNIIAQGSGVVDKSGKTSVPNFFVVGDQISSFPGWQEGAIASALNALSRMTRPDLEIPHLACLPDPRLMVEGI